jgi:hypothetical protein
VRSSRRNRKVTSVVAGCARAAVAAVGLAQPFLTVPVSQAAASYQPSLADITRANPQTYGSGESGDTAQAGDDKSGDGASTEQSLVSGRSDVTVELEPEPEPEPEPTEESTTESTESSDASSTDSSSGESSGGSSSYPDSVSYDTGTVKGDAQAYLASQGYSGSEWACFDAIITQESGWNPSATNASSGAYGLPQALPGSKMASAGADWQTNPVTQVKWALGYMVGRYGSPCGAYDFKFTQGNGWY